MEEDFFSNIIVNLKLVICDFLTVCSNAFHSKTSYDDWLSRKKEAEKQQRDAERQIRQQRLQEKKHK